MSKIFNSHIIEAIPNKLTFHFINIENYDEIFKNFIDDSIASIWNGVLGDDDLEVIKIELKNWFIDKDYKKKAGFTAEFFCHLYMKSLDYEQHFIFQNLEEQGSMKKGFDGLYQFNDEMWLYESKSSLHTTASANHNSNIGEAFHDIDKKLKGKKIDQHGNPISPWRNAISHASQVQVNPDITLINNLHKFKNNFAKENFDNIENFNVIPSSTIYLEDRWAVINNKELETKF